MTGCGWRLGNVRQTLSRTAQKDLLVYTWAQYVDDELLRAFQQMSHIPTQSEVFDANETMFAALQAGKGGNFSILYPSEYFIPKLVEAGIIEPLDYSRLTNLNSLMPQFRPKPDDRDHHYGIPFSWGTTGVIYNSDKIPNGFEDWDALWSLKEKLTRKVTLLSDSREVIGMALKSLGYSLNEENPDRIRQAYEKLTKLKPHLASFTTDGWKSRIAAGDLWAAMCYSSDAKPLIKANPKLRYTVPKPGAALWSDWVVIPKAAPNPDAAYQWINYLLQDEVAASLALRLSVTTPNANAIKRLPPEIQNSPVSYPSQDILDRCEAMKALKPETEVVLDKYWNQLIS